VPSGREERPRPSACLNCGSTLVESFCASCGQRNLDVRIPARELALDAVEDGLSLDSRVARTVGPFLFRPGLLTVEWTSGRRARYSSPLRLYLLTSAVFFLAASLSGDGGPAIRFDAEDGKAVREQVAGELAAAGIDPATDPADVLRGTEAAHRKLRDAGWIGVKIDDRWRSYGNLTLEQFGARVNASFREWTPRVMFFLVPAAVLILALLWRRRWLSEHVVLALHLHAFAFAVFTAMLALRLLPWTLPGRILRPALLLALGAYFLLALRRVHGETWGRTIAKGALAGVLYGLALSVGLVGIALLALYFG
jgi:hypothetical protein